MKKIKKLKICDWSLSVLTVAMLISGVYLEATGSSGYCGVWIHIAVGILFFIFVAYHIFLHYGKSNWFSRFHKQKNQYTRILWWVSLLTLITGIVTAIHWLATEAHSPLGGIHGKIGFLMILLSAGHILKRIRFFKIK